MDKPTPTWKQRLSQLKTEIRVLYLACQDPRMPWYARLLAVCVVGYAFSPIDLIPDFIPILGYLDDLLLIPLGVYVTLKLIPSAVLDDCRAKANQFPAGTKPVNKIAGAIIIAVWIATSCLIIGWFYRKMVQK